MRDIYLRAKGRTVIRRGDMLDLIYHNIYYKYNINIKIQGFLIEKDQRNTKKRKRSCQLAFLPATARVSGTKAQATGLCLSKALLLIIILRDVQELYICVIILYQVKVMRMKIKNAVQVMVLSPNRISILSRTKTLDSLDPSPNVTYLN